MIRIRDWGFATREGWVPWRQYTSTKEGFDQAAYEQVVREVYGERK